MMRRLLFFAFVFALVSGPLWVAGQATGVEAEAYISANLRSAPNIEGDLVGEIQNGTRYPVIGRSELYPWVLLGEVGTLAPKGWVFQDLVEIYGDLFVVPFTEQVVTPGAILPATVAPVGTPPADTTAPVGEPTATLRPDLQVTPLNSGAAGGEVVAPQPTLTPTLTTPPGPTGSVQGEINVRYGPGTEFQIVGKAFAGEILTITGYHTQVPWLRVAFAASPNGQAWIAENLLQVEGNVFLTEAVTTLDFSTQPTLTPTPAMQVSSSRPGQSDGPTVSPAFAALGDTLWNAILAWDFVPESQRFGALYLENLQTDEAIAYGSSFAFSGTSINKIAILLGYFAAVDGTPSLTEARDIANTMICSENVATNRLLEIAGQGDALFGAEQTTQILQRLGLTRTFITAPYDTTTAIATATPLPRPPQIPVTDADQQKSSPDPTNQVTVEEMGWLLGDIYQCAYQESGPLLEDFGAMFTPQECRKMLYIMGENTVDGMMKAGVPADVRVSHKHGWINTTHTNAGIFYTPGGDYVMVMALYQPEWLAFPESLPVFAETARSVYNHFNPTDTLDIVREGFIPEAGQCNYTTTDTIVSNLASSAFQVNNDTTLFNSENAISPSEDTDPSTLPTLRPTWTPVSPGG